MLSPNWSHRRSFPARKELNCDESLLLAAAPTNHITVVRRRPDRLYPFQAILPPSLLFFSEVIPQLIPPSEATVPCQHFKRTQILINRPWVAPKPRQVGWKSQTNNTLMSGLDCLRSCNANPMGQSSDRILESKHHASVMDVWKCGEGRMKLELERRGTICCCCWVYVCDVGGKGKKEIQLQAVRNVFLSSQSWSG